MAHTNLKERLLDSCNDDEEEEEEEQQQQGPTAILTLDKAFERAGEFGKFQKRFFAFVLVYQTVAVFHILPITFVGLEPEWKCARSLNSSVLTLSERCVLYEDKQGRNTSLCTPEYTDRFHSITQEFNLICNQSYKVNLTQSFFFFGFLLGSFILGYLADKIGRRKLVIGYIVALTVVAILTAISPNYNMFALGRFLVGFFVSGGLTMYVLICEIIGPSQRSLLAVTTACVFGSSFGCLSIVAYLLPYWRGVTLLSGIGTIVFVLFSKYIPESPRWLYVTGRDNEARQSLINIALINGQPLPFNFSLKPSQKVIQSPGIMDFFNRKKMRTRMTVQMLEWFTVCMVYYGLSLGVGRLSSSLYIGFALSGIVEIPSNFFSFFTLEKIGRKWSNVGFIVFAGLACLMCSYVQFSEIDSSGDVKLALNLFGKFSIAATFTVIYTYTPELIPTDMRNFGLGIANVCARSGGIIAPMIILLDSHTPGVSMLIMGSLSIMTGLICLYLPETLNTPLPNTLDELN